MKKVTIYDVAKEADVSLATVSRVLNKSAIVRPDKEKRVLEAIKKLNFRPNEIARGLARKRSTTVGVIVPEISRTSAAELLSGIFDTANMDMYKYSINLKTYTSNLEHFEEQWNSLISSQVDGILVMCDYLDEHTKTLIKSTNVPVVLFSTECDDKKIPSVSINFTQAVYDATKHFTDKKYTDIVFLNRDANVHTGFQTNGFEKALKDAGISGDLSKNVHGAKKNYEADYAYFKEVLSKHKPQAVVSMSSALAAAFMNAAQDMGIKIPEDIEVISFSDDQTAQMLRPTLTSVTQQVYRIGVYAMRLLTKYMLNEEVDQPIIEDSYEFIWRGSTK
ncbi:LacI family DNA-binding transcriptional regulator [Culicoidibacter larvae]|uniref:LacI family DNA-binding transcriptional regulator n=1 Tax=Culicoidibacter larvae TaxID=2579976 RepID=A0A5R8QGS3_9FIRM|nr:LacI family DNA-binding transcriptional regulator [Culicoidibacter larvae]TLG76663.1 LacI family DNA-binding transcriptional regulator [Culicoidibacter larvae]